MVVGGAGVVDFFGEGPARRGAFRERGGETQANWRQIDAALLGIDKKIERTEWDQPCVGVGKVKIKLTR